MNRHSSPQRSLPEKINRILNTLLVILILIAIKLWHLTSVEHDQKIEAAKGSQRRTVYERAERATITDRFGIPLAVNQVQYNAAILYSEINQLPRWAWRRDSANKRYKVFIRKEHITTLAKTLGEMLSLDSVWLEDTIHSKAAILGNIPCIIKENISEEQYFRLKMMEGELKGVYAEHVAKRCYPQGKLAGEVIGYLGAMSQDKYQSVTRELKALHEIIALYEEQGPSYGVMNSASLEEAKKRLKELEEQAYHINDQVGKAGVEALYDHKLRGSRGKRVYLTDRQGNFLREIEEGNAPVSGTHLQMTISAELQLYAEELLAEFERREMIPLLEQNVATHFPWIKGGAIVVMEPESGEILTLASYPRFDPNDFIKSGVQNEDLFRQKRVLKWLENDSYLGSIWNQEHLLEREKFDPVRGQFYEEALLLDWATYLSFLGPEKAPVLEQCRQFNTIEDSVIVQKNVESLLECFFSERCKLSPPKIFNAIFEEGENLPIFVRLTLDEKEFLEESREKHKEKIELLTSKLNPYFSALSYNGDKLLYVDLCRLVIDGNRYSQPLLKEVGKKTLNAERQIQVAKGRVERALKEIVHPLFEQYYFKKWREEHFKEYIVQKREVEKKAKLWAKPYLEYLEAEEEEQFEKFWEENRIKLLISFLSGEENESEPCQSSLILWSKELSEGAHRALDWISHYEQLKMALKEISPSLWSSYLMSMRSFHELKRPLLGSYSYLHGEGERLEKDLAAAFYPKYGFGYMRSHAFRQATTAGSIFKVVCSYEVLKQRYLKLQGRNANFSNLNPLTIIDDKHRSYKAEGKWNVGYTMEGEAIPLFYKGGRLPRSEHSGIGKVDLLRALETSSNPYFSIVAGTLLDDPEDLCQAASLFGYGMKSGIDLPGEYQGHLPKDVAYNRTGLYSFAIGQHSLAITPLQSAVMFASLANGGGVLKPFVIKKQITEKGEFVTEEERRWHLFMPEEINHLLLTGLRRVVMGESGTARNIQRHFPSAIVNNLIGKTSTAEEMEKIRFDGLHTVHKVQHISFGSIFYNPEYPPLTKPELIVVVYLRHGRYGRLAAPLAAKVAERWLEIKARHRE